MISISAKQEEESNSTKIFRKYPNIALIWHFLLSFVKSGIKAKVADGSKSTNTFDYLINVLELKNQS